MPPASMFAKLRACLLALPITLGACDAADRLSPTEIPTEAAAIGENLAEATEPAVVSFSGTSMNSTASAGIPFGFFRQPTTAVSATYNGAKMTVGPNYVLRTLQETRARGGRLFLMLADAEVFYKDANGHFSMEKWKARIDRYRNIDFSSYINDGTIIAHFLIDEPQDPTNWNGVPLTGAQMEEMAKYSKQLWPRMATLVRAPPAKIRWSGTYRYLDAAWAQVENVRGGLNIQEFLDQNVSSARSQGLALAVGLNVTKGGLNKTRMTAGQIKSYGAVLLSSSYPCAFISWMYDAPYLAQSDIREAVASLSEKARNRPTNSCHTKSQVPVPDDGNTPGDDDGAEPDNGSGSGNEGSVPGKVSPTPGSVTGIALRLSGWRKAKRPYVVLNWSGATGTRVDIYRDGRVVYAGALNDRKLVDTKGLKKRTSYTYKVCERGTSRCSNQAVTALQ